MNIINSIRHLPKNIQMRQFGGNMKEEQLVAALGKAAHEMIIYRYESQLTPYSAWFVLAERDYVEAEHNIIDGAPGDK